MEYIDLSEEQITKRQHYVPRAYLKYFAFDEQKPPHVYAVFSNSKESQPVSIEKICCQSYLYEQIAIDSDSGAHIFAAPNELEELFGTIEDKYSEIIEKLRYDLDKNNDFELTAKEIGVLRGFASSLMMRHPVFVHIANAIVEKYCAHDPKFIGNIQAEFPEVPLNVLISHVAHGFLRKYLFISTIAMADTMENSQICIFRAQSTPFITSSMPVANIYGQKDGADYDLVGLPITPDYFLAFIDVGIPIPKVVTVDEYSVKRINCRQVHGKNNILISNKKDFLSCIDFSFETEDDDDSWLYSMLSVDKETALKEYHEIMNAKEIKYWR